MDGIEDAMARYRSMVDHELAVKARGGPSVNEAIGTAVTQAMGGYGKRSRSQDSYRYFRDWVYAAVNCIAKRAAAQPIKIGRMKARGKPDQVKAFKTLASIYEPYRRSGASLLGNKSAGQDRDDLTVIEQHPFLDAISDPNELMVTWQMVYNTLAHLELTGETHWWIVRDKKRFQIWPIPSHWIEPNHVDNFNSSWKLRPAGSAQEFDVDGRDVFYCYYPDPENPFASLSPLRAIMRAVQQDKDIQTSQMQAFKNGIWPGLGVVIGDIANPNGTNRPLLEKEQRQQITHAIMSHMRGAINYNTPIILDALISDVKELTRANKEMDWFNSSSLTKKRILQGFGVNEVSLGEIEGANRACHDTATELLTRRGWLRYDEVHDGDVAGTINPDTHRFEWQKIQQTHIYDYDGEMVRLKGEKLDVMVTPEHRMWTTRHIAGKRRNDRPWVFKPASDLKCHDAMLLAPGQMPAQHVMSFKVPGLISNSRFKPDLVVPMTPFLAFLGWWVSEGWTSGTRTARGGRQSYSIGIKQAVGAELECSEIEASVRSISPGSVCKSYTPAKPGSAFADGYDRQATYTWGMSDKRLWTWLRKNCGVGANNKRLPKFVFDLPGSQLQILLDALLLGDGSHRVATETKNYSGKTATYFTSSIQLADQVQTLAMLCGRSSRRCKRMKNGVYPVSVSTYTDRMSLLPRHIGRERYSGKVWCITVPNGLIITRRNGKPLISGNSSGFADEHFVSNVLNPKLELISQCLTAWFSPIFAGKNEQLVIWIEPCVPNDRSFTAELYNKAKELDCVTVNEYRQEVLSLPPIDGGDELAADKEERKAEEEAKQEQLALREQQQIEDKRAEQAASNPKKPQPGDDESAEEGMNEEDEDGDEEENTPAGRAARAQNKREPAKKQEKKKPKAKKAALIAGPGGDPSDRPFGETNRSGISKAQYEAIWLKRHGLHEASFAKVLEKLFADQCESALARLRRVRGKDLSKSELAKELFPTAEWNEDLVKLARPQLLQAATAGAAMELALVKSIKLREKPVTIDIPPAVVDGIEDFLDETFQQDYWGGINETTQERLTDTISEGIQAGDGPELLAYRVREVLGPKVSARRALMIARTESTGALSGGRHAAWEELAEAGMITTIEWLGVSDEKQRETHAKADGQKIKPGGMFKVGGHKTPHPGHWSLPVGERAGCRCFTAVSGVFSDDDEGKSFGDQFWHKGAGPHKFASTQVNLPVELAERLIGMGLEIPDEDLAEDGRENEGHCTLLYGIHAADPLPVIELLRGTGKIKATLGKASVFHVSKPDREPFDVLKLDVDSPDLHRLNKLLKDNLEHTSTFPKYVPHCTLVYCKPGAADHLVGDARFAGTEIEFSEVIFSDQDGKRTLIPLG